MICVCPYFHKPRKQTMGGCVDYQSWRYGIIDFGNATSQEMIAELGNVGIGHCGSSKRAATQDKEHSVFHYILNVIM